MHWVNVAQITDLAGIKGRAVCSLDACDNSARAFGTVIATGLGLALIRWADETQAWVPQRKLEVLVRPLSEALKR